MFFGNYGDVTSRLPMIRKDQKAKVRKPVSSSKLIYIYLLSFTDLTLVPIACHHMLLLLAVLMHCKFLYIPQILQHVMCFFVCLFVCFLQLRTQKKEVCGRPKAKISFLKDIVKRQHYDWGKDCPWPLWPHVYYWSLQRGLCQHFH